MAFSKISELNANMNDLIWLAHIGVLTTAGGKKVTLLFRAHKYHSTVTELIHMEFDPHLLVAGNKLITIKVNQSQIYCGYNSNSPLIYVVTYCRNYVIFLLR